jgi:hypothetical protein
MATTVYISIGTPKTGTTALQNFMGRNDSVMRKQGYCYPRLKLGISGLYKDRNGQFLIYESRQANKAAHEAEVKRKAYEQLGKLAKQYPNIVLSDEQIWYRCRRDENFWQEVVDDFRKIDCEVKVIVYLRRQDLLIQSLWNQSIKMFRKGTMTFQEAIEKNYFRYFPLDYYENLKFIEKTLGKENIIVRPYERGRFEGEEHSIFSDFFQSVGLKLTDEFDREGVTRNLGLEGNYIEIKRQMNGIPEYREMRDFLSRPVLYASTYYSELGEHEKTGMFSYEEQVAYLAQFEESNQKVAEEYLGRKGEPLFYDGTVKELPQWSLKEEAMYRDIITCMTEAFVAQEKKIIELQQQVHELNVVNHPLQKLYRKWKEKFR